MERLWAYITIRQLLDEDAIQSTKQNRYSYEADGPTTPKPNITKPTPKESALKIALKVGSYKDGLHLNLTEHCVNLRSLFAYNLHSPKYTTQSLGFYKTMRKGNTQVGEGKKFDELTKYLVLKAGWESITSSIEQFIIFVHLILTFIMHLITENNELVYVETAVNERLHLGPKDRALNIALKVFLQDAGTIFVSMREASLFWTFQCCLLTIPLHLGYEYMTRRFTALLSH